MDRIITRIKSRYYIIIYLLLNYYLTTKIHTNYISNYYNANSQRIDKHAFNITSIS